MKVDWDSDHGIERMPSIVKEPRTLSFDQIKYAREAALYVLSNSSVEEAMRIFTEGLEPVLGVGSSHMDMAIDPEEEIEMFNPTMVDRVQLVLRDIVTAPF